MSAVGIRLIGGPADGHVVCGRELIRGNDGPLWFYRRLKGGRRGMTWVKAEWEYFLWNIGWRKFCQPCDEIYWGWGKSHGVRRGCHCLGLWRR